MTARTVHSPMVLQMEAAECGAAALGIVLAHHGRWVPLSELRVRCGVSRDGSRASSVVKVARSYGLEAQGYKKSLEALRELEPPFVVFWQFNHFLVVDGFEGDEVLLNDPAHGHRRLPIADFDRDFTGVTLVMRPGPDFAPGGAPPSVLAGVLARLEPVRRPLTFVAAAALLLTMTGLASAVFVQIYVDDVLVGRQRAWVAPLLVAMGVLLAQQLSLVWLRDLVLRRVRLVLAAGASRGFVEHLLRLPVVVHAQRHVGDLASRVALNDTLAEVLSGHLAMAAVDTAMLALVVVVMLTYDPCLTVFSVLGGAATVMGVRSFTRRRTEAEARHLQALSRERSVAISGLRDLETIKASGLEDDLFVTWSEEFLASVGTGQELTLSAARLGLLARTLAATNTVLVLVVGGWRVLQGGLSIGVLIGFQLLVAAFHAPLLRLLGRAADLQALRGDVARLDDLLEQPPDRAPTEEPDVAVQGRVRAHAASFAFDGVHGDLLSEVDLDVAPGTRVALVGASGSGKSTLLRLLAGLLRPRSGEILLDDVPVRSWPERTFGDRVACVDQDIVLFEGTVRENLTLWDPSVPDTALVRACRDAEVLDVVQALPGGFDAELPEGATNLSGGQRQRLELARALVREPAVLLLDEATSALDPETEGRIDAHLRRRGCTVIIAAHRLSTVRDADEIVVLDGGRVVERGRHDELVARAGAYAALLREEAGDGFVSAPDPADLVTEEATWTDTETAGVPVVRLDRLELALAERRAAERSIRELALHGRDLPTPSGDPFTDAAALVADALGLALPPAALALRPRDAIDAEHVERWTRLARCRARRVELTGAWWEEGGPPLLAVADGAPTALLSDRRGRYVRVDPGDGRRRPLDPVAAKAFSPVAWQLVRPLPDREVGLRELLGFSLVGVRADLLRAVGWGVGATLVGMGVPVATGLLVDVVLPDADLGGVLLLGLGLLAATAADAAFDAAQIAALTRLDGQVSATAQLALWDRLLRLPSSFFRGRSAGDTSSRVSAVTAVSRRLTGLTLTAILGGALAALDLALLVTLDARLAAVSVVSAGLVVAATAGPTLIASRAATALVEQRGRVLGATVQLLGGVAKIRAAGVADAAVAWWWRRYREQLGVAWQLWSAHTRVALVSAAAPVLTTAALFLATSALRDAGVGPTPGVFLAVAATSSVFVAGVVSLVEAFLDLAEARAEARRARPLLVARHEVRPGTVAPGELGGEVAIERLRFRYRADGPYVMDGLSLKVKPGEMVGLVGASGCGKSTLVRLLLGFEQPESGQVLYDGHNLAGLDTEAVRRQLGVVLQSGRIGNASILEVVSGAHRVSLDDAWRALRAAGLQREVEAMPMGIHTLVGEGGANLSGGQRQRLLIARALVSRPKILIFDEATSALDNRSQAEVAENLARLRVTRIVVAHRASTLRHADRICVLEHGRIARIGTWDEIYGPLSEPPPGGAGTVSA